MDELIYASATELAQAIRDKKVSSKEAVDAFIKRIDTVNPQLNAVVQLPIDIVQSEARKADIALARGDIKGPLHGVPFTVKDSIETAGVISTGGTKGRASYIPTGDATVVARMRSAGAILLGVTNVPEFACWFESDNLVYGRTNNPYDVSRTPGGSSGGEAAIIAAGGSPLGLGSDGGGSIRLPVHFCGIAGIKPTTGRVPNTGHYPRSLGLWDPLQQIGPLARFVEDLILTLPVIAGIDWQDAATVPMPLGHPSAVDLKSLRVAFHTDNGIVSPTPETIEVVNNTARALSDAGMAVEEACPESIKKVRQLSDLWSYSDGGAEYRRELQLAGTKEVSPLVDWQLKQGSDNPVTSAELCSLIVEWDMFRSDMLSFLEKYDVVICPVNAYPAIAHGTSIDDDIVPSFDYTWTYNLTGWPGVVVRGGTSPEGLPIGVQVIARPWHEDVALAVAQHVETVLGGWHRPNI